MSVLRRVIKRRQQVQDLFRTFEADHESNKTHAHFITKLNEISEILQKAFDSSPKVPTSTHPHRSHTSQKPELLSITQEPDTEDEPNTDSEHDEFLRLEQESGTKYDVETSESEIDAFTAAVSLFNDMMETMREVRRIWMNYRTGEYHLVGCAITTDLMLKVLHAQEQQFYKDLPNGYDARGFVVNCYKSIYSSHFQRPLEVNNAVKEFEEDPVSYIHCRSFFFDLCLFLPQPGQWGTSKEYPNYGDDITGLYRPYGTCLVTLPRALHRRDEQLLKEIMFEAQGLRSAPRSIVPTDAVRASFWSDFKTEKDVSFTSICGADACRMILEDLDGCSTRPYEQLKHAARAISKSLKTAINEIKQGDIVQDDLSHIIPDCKELIRELDKWVLNDGVKKHVQPCVDSDNLKARRPDFHLFKQHPIVCGLTLFNIYTKFIELAFVRLHAEVTVVYAVHLYKALRRTNSLQQSWADMELFLKFQPAVRQHVESGSNGVASIGWRFTTHVNALGPNRTPRPHPKTKQIKRRVGAYCTYGPPGILTEIYCDHGEVDDVTIGALDHICQGYAKGKLFEHDLHPDPAGMPLRTKRLLDRPKPRTRNISEEEAKEEPLPSKMSLLFSFAGSADNLTTFDYFDFGRQCRTMMKKMKEHLRWPPTSKVEHWEPEFMLSLFEMAGRQEIGINIPSDAASIFGHLGREMNSLLSSTAGQKIYSRQTRRSEQEGTGFSPEQWAGLSETLNRMLLEYKP